jgi:hypothetical protein
MATPKQKAAFKEITEKNRPVSVVMREVGYSKSFATKPSQLTNSLGWQELMDEYFPDDKLAKTHGKLLDNKSPKIQLGALGLAYKVKGKEQAQTQVLNFIHLTDEQLSQRIRELSERAGSAASGTDAKEMQN